MVEQLLKRGQRVKIIVRSVKELSEKTLLNENLSVIQASVLNLGDEQLIEHVSDCDALASCLGHNMTFNGLFGAPRRLVT